jgi:hypothetical protein
MDKRWLTAFAFRGSLRRYDETVLTGFEALVLAADDDKVTVATHDLYKTYVENLPWPTFVDRFVFDPVWTPENMGRQLLNTGRTIAMKHDKDVLPAIARCIENHADLDEVPMKKKSKEPPVSSAVTVCQDYYRHSCIVLRRGESSVDYIALNRPGGLDVEAKDSATFDEYWVPSDTYPAEKAARLYVEFAQHLGATPEAMRELAKLTTVSEKEQQMATAKAPTAADAKTKPTPAVKNVPAAKKATVTAAKPDAKAAPAAAKKPAKPPVTAKADPKAAKVDKAPKEKKPSAASRFQELIMEGKLTDDNIFATVKKEFGLSDDKRGYVTWYRNHLKKNGKNPPAAIEAKK